MVKAKEPILMAELMKVNLNMTIFSMVKELILMG